MIKIKSVSNKGTVVELYTDVTKKDNDYYEEIFFIRTTHSGVTVETPKFNNMIDAGDAFDMITKRAEDEAV